MKKNAFLIASLFLSIVVNLVPAAEKEATVEPKNLAFRAVPFTSVHFQDRFWTPRLKTNREVSIPHNYKWCEETGRFENFAKAADLQDGKFRGIYFNDSDVYKLIEGTAYSLADHPDPALQKRADHLIDWIAAAQEKNGYLNTYYTLVEPEKKWSDTHVKHELYCAGHLTEAAVAYEQATGERTLLDVAEKFVDHIAATFGPEPGQKVEVPGHEEIELALIKLYQLTGNEKYLTLSKFFVDSRGDQAVRTDKLQGPYSQDDRPIREQSEITGHAVRAMYLYAGVADLAGYTGDAALIEAMQRLWNDVVNKKMYITGGIGARHEGEAFGDAFELPNATAYCETCAAIGLVFWAHRLNLMHGEAKYADVLERAMYNGVLSGIGLDGKSFFYVNPLASNVQHHRQPFFDCACCPTNVVRFVPSLPGYQYATDEDGLIVNQYVAGEAVVEHPTRGKITVKMQTDYPWSGLFKFDLAFEKPQTTPFVLKYRVPGWTSGNFRLGMKNGYVLLSATDPNRMSGSILFPVETERVVANPNVQADRGRVAIRRGPLVYCFEQCDNAVPVDRIMLARNPEFRYDFKPDLLCGLGVIRCKNVDGRELTAVPYFAWDHREPGKMSVWVRQEGLTRTPKTDDPNWTDSRTGEPILYGEFSESLLDKPETLAPHEQAVASASHCWVTDLTDAIAYESVPKDSNDYDLKRHTFWPNRGTKEWVEYTFEKPATVSKCSLYWFDDEPRNGGCRTPKSWSLSYRKGNDWVPVATQSAFGVAKDKFNIVEFAPVETTALRIDVALQDAWSGGVLRWYVE